MAAHNAGAQDDESQGAYIFSDLVSMRIKPAAREEYVASITVRLRPDNAAHPRSLLLELTDESDLFFYHSLLLSEGDFHTLKSEQRLLVDFQSFPLQLVELLRRCMETSDSPAGTALSLNSAASGASSLRIVACLDCSSGGESTFNIIESNQFRELTHIGLKLRAGTDDTVKKHLAGKLRLYRTESADLAERLAASDEAVSQLRRQVEELATRTRVVVDERTHSEQSLVIAHQRELAETKQAHARELIELQQASNLERSRIESELQQAVSKMTARAETAERQSEELQHQTLSLTSSGKSYRERLETSDAQLQESRQDMKVLREQQKQLELLKYQHEREIGERDVHLTSLKEQLVNKEQLVTNQASQLEQSGSQRKNVEDSLAMTKHQVSSLEEKFNLSAQEIAKGNQIIQKFRTDIKQLKGKLRLKAEALTQQEKSVFDLERSEETGRHMVEEKVQELLRSKEHEERHRQDVEDLKKKLAEAHEVLKSNHDVIEYLNRQLTERDLKTLPPVVADLAAGSERDARSNNALADLLKRTEALGRGLKPMGVNALSPSSTSFNMTGLSELGFSSSSGAAGLYTSGFAATQPSMFGTSASGLGAGAPALGGLGADLLSEADVRFAGGSSASVAASLAAGRNLLSGPVAYRNPGATLPIAVK